MSLHALACVALLFAPSPVQELEVSDPPAQAKVPAEVHTRDAAETLSVWHREVVTFRASFKDGTPERRVERALARLELVKQAGNWEVIAVAAQVGELSGYYVTVDGANIFGLIEEDLDPVDSPPLEAIAKRAAEDLRAVLVARWSARRPGVLLRGLGFAAGATLVFAILLRLLSRLVSFAADRLPKLLPKLKLRWRPSGFDLSESVGELRVFAIRLISLIAGLGLTYLWLTFTLAQFPYTEPWSDELGDLLLASLRTSGDSVMNAIPGLFAVFIIFAITRMITRLIGSFFSAVERGATHVAWLEAETAKATRRIVTVMVWLGALMIAYPHIPGSGTTAFKGVSVFLGLLVTVGSTGLVNQVMSGLVVLYSRTLKAGDYVRIGEDEGVVSGVGFLSTRLATPKQEEIVIPNSVLTNKIVRNLSRIDEQHGVVAWTAVTIGYDTPWQQVEQLLLDAAERTEHLRAQPAPYVLQAALSDFYVHYDLIFHVAQPELRGRTLSLLHREIQDGFNAAGVQIMSPHFNRQPDQPVLVAQADDAAAPAAQPPEA